MLSAQREALRELSEPAEIAVKAIVHVDQASKIVREITKWKCRNIQSSFESLRRSVR